MTSACPADLCREGDKLKDSTYLCSTSFSFQNFRQTRIPPEPLLLKSGIKLRTEWFKNSCAKKGGKRLCTGAFFYQKEIPSTCFRTPQQNSNNSYEFEATKKVRFSSYSQVMKRLVAER